MKRHMLTRVVATVMALTLAAGVMTGCNTSSGKGEKTSDGNKTLFTYDGEKVPLKEAWIYAKMVGAQYEASYSTYFGENFWTMEMGTDEDGNPTTFEEYVKEQVITQIKQVIVLDNKASELKCSLTDAEKEECAGYAKAFAEDETGKSILAECGATEEDVAQLYEENALASKVQQEMVKDTDTEVSDDEARETTIYRIVFETTTTDDEGKTVDMSEKEKAKVLKKAQNVWKQIEGGTSIEDAAKAQEYTNTDETFAAGESEEGEAFEKLLPNMKDGEMVSGVQECDNGYVIAKLVAYTDEEATASNKKNIIAERQQETFRTTYDEWTKDLEKEWDYSEDVDQELWAQLVLHSEESTATEAAEETTGAAETATEAATEATTAAK